LIEEAAHHPLNELEKQGGVSVSGEGEAISHGINDLNGCSSQREHRTKEL
jgi:hypothetical protein